MKGIYYKLFFSRILDIWDAHKIPFTALGIAPILGDVKSSTTDEECENRIVCCVKSQLFPTNESYRLTISSEKVGQNFLIVFLTQFYSYF